MMARVWPSFIREPTPYGPPVHPVLTSQAPDLMLLDPLGEHLGVADGVEDQERRAEAGREGDLRAPTMPTSVPATLAV